MRVLEIATINPPQRALNRPRSKPAAKLDALLT
jgi:hypothetical protein